MDDSDKLRIKGRVWSDEEIVEAERVAAAILGSLWADASGPRELSADEYIGLVEKGGVEMYRLDAAVSAVIAMADRVYQISDRVSGEFLRRDQRSSDLVVGRVSEEHVATSDGARYVSASIRSLFGCGDYAAVDVPADRCGASSEAFGVRVCDEGAAMVLSFVRTAIPRPSDAFSLAMAPLVILLEEVVRGDRRIAGTGWTQRSKPRGWIPAAAAASFVGFVASAGPSEGTGRYDIDAARSLSDDLRRAMWQFEIGGTAGPEVVFSLTAAQSTALEAMPGRLIPVKGWKAMEALRIASEDKESRGHRWTWRMPASLAHWVVSTVKAISYPDHTLRRAADVVLSSVRTGAGE